MSVHHHFHLHHLSLPHFFYSRLKVHLLHNSTTDSWYPSACLQGLLEPVLLLNGFLVFVVLVFVFFWLGAVLSWFPDGF